MGAYTHHHFVPQFCLREFAVDSARRRIATYVIDKQLYVPTASVRAQAQRSKLYGSDEREKLLSQIESAAAVVLHAMVDRSEHPHRHSADHSTLLVHVLFQSARTPVAVQELEEQANQMMKVMMSHDQRIAP